MDSFVIWLVESDEVNAEVDRLVASVGGFVPSSDKPYPGAGTDTPDAYDLAGVIAGVKPACGVSPEFVRSPVGQEMVKRARAMGMDVTQGFGILGGGPGQFCIGRPQNVRAIIGAFKTINELDNFIYTSKSSQEAIQVAERILDAHDVVGRNLGYPENALQRFRGHMMNQFKQRMAKRFGGVGV